MNRHWYGIEYAYGPNAVNNGQRPDLVHRFALRQERDAWVDESDPHQDSDGKREALPRSDQRVQVACSRGQPWPVPLTGY